MMRGQIRQSLSGYYDVMTSDGQEYRTRARGNFRKKKQTPLVGDFVDFKAEKADEGYILGIQSRKNQLVRPPVANVDKAVVVTACVEPDFSANLLDRQLVMLASNGIEPLIYFSKYDLVSTADQCQVLAEIATYYRQYYPTFIPQTPAEQKQVQAELLSELQGQVCVVMGQTGAGKSTLLNQLDPALQLETGEVSKALSRGKHTTRKVSLLDIHGALIADTPGFSSFELSNLTKEDLPRLYPDFQEYATACKFRGCSHIKEPQCAVRDAVASEKIWPSRYENYLQFYKMVVDDEKKKYR